MFHRTGPLIACALFAVLPACQPEGPPALSLEEAKTATASFEGQAFTPPPKTIDDITAILDQQPQIDPEAARRAREAAYRQPPADADRDDLAQFYWKRGMAAREIGDVRRQHADLKAAERLSRDGDGETRQMILLDLSVVELLVGNRAEAMRLREESLPLIPSNRLGAVIVRNALLSVHYARGGDLVTADRRFDQAEEIFDEIKFGRSWSEWGHAWTGHLSRARANILDVRGRYADAEPLYRSAITNFRADLGIHPDFVYGPLLVAATQAELGQNLVRQGRMVEGEVETRRALTEMLRTAGRFSQDTAIQLRALVLAIAAQGRAAEAARLAHAQIDIYRQIGAPKDSFQLARARQELAGALVSQRKWAAALVQFDTIRSGLADDRETFERFFAGDPVWALALLGAGRAGEAHDIARAAYERNRRVAGAKHYDTAEARGILAVALSRLGRREAALAAFADAASILLAQSRLADNQNTAKAVRAQRLEFILNEYIGLLATIRGSAVERASGLRAAAEAFRIADAARGQIVQLALAASSARAAARNPDLADLARREQDALKRIGALNGLYANAASVPAGQQNAAAIADLRKRIDTLRAARAALAEEIEKRFPDYAALMNPKPATIDQARSALRPGEALIATYVGETASYVWAVPKTGRAAFAVAPLGRGKIAAIVRDLRRALDPRAATLGDIPAFDVAAAHDLYRTLLAPVAAGWKDAGSLLVVAHGALGQLPFPVLVTEAVTPAPETAPLFSNYRAVPFLARSHAVTVLPSVSSLMTLRSLPPGSKERRSFAGFGDPWFSAAQMAEAAAPAPPDRTVALASRGLIAVRGLSVSLRAAPKLNGVSSADLAKLPRLPDTADEVKSIALAMNADVTRDVFTGREASEGRVKSMTLAGYRVLAFATHGLVPGDLDGLAQPALALSSPKVAGGGDDGLLTLGEILALRLDADWVVLSACNTASGDGAGAEAVSGLGRAFFYAGTRALLVSNWPVETTSARALTTDLFRRQTRDASLTRAEALRRSMLNLIDKGGLVDGRGRIVFSYAHPIFWAPFSLVGDGGGGKPAS